MQIWFEPPAYTAGNCYQRFCLLLNTSRFAAASANTCRSLLESIANRDEVEGPTGSRGKRVKCNRTRFLTTGPRNRAIDSCWHAWFGNPGTLNESGVLYLYVTKRNENKGGRVHRAHTHLLSAAHVSHLTRAHVASQLKVPSRCRENQTRCCFARKDKLYKKYLEYLYIKLN